MLEYGTKVLDFKNAKIEYRFVSIERIGTGAMLADSLIKSLQPGTYSGHVLEYGFDQFPRVEHYEFLLETLEYIYVISLLSLIKIIHESLFVA